VRRRVARVYGDRLANQVSRRRWLPPLKRCYAQEMQRVSVFGLLPQYLLVQIFSLLQVSLLVQSESALKSH
jgi:hypothetical protein